MPKLAITIIVTLALITQSAGAYYLMPADSVKTHSLRPIALNNQTDDEWQRLLVVESASEITRVALDAEGRDIADEIASELTDEIARDDSRHIVNTLHAISGRLGLKAQEAISGMTAELAREEGEFDYTNLAYQALVTVIRRWPKRHMHTHVGNSTHEGFAWNEMVLHNESLFSEFERCIDDSSLGDDEKPKRIAKLRGLLERQMLWHQLDIKTKDEIIELFKDYGLKRNIGVYDLESRKRVMTHVALQHFADGVSELYILPNIEKVAKRGTTGTRRQILEAIIEGAKEAERLAEIRYGRKFTVRLAPTFSRQEDVCTPENVEEAVDEIIALRKEREEYRRYIVGIDISGAEALMDRRMNTRYRATSDFRASIEKAAANGLRVISHLGDMGFAYRATDAVPSRTPGRVRQKELSDIADRERYVSHHLKFLDDGIMRSGPITDVNHATILAPKGSVITKGPRMGHSFAGQAIEDPSNLATIDRLLGRLRQMHIEIHTCPTGNTNTQRIAMYKGHPLHQWLKMGNRFSINADDFYWGKVRTTLSDDIAKMLLSAPLNGGRTFLSTQIALDISQSARPSAAKASSQGQVDEFESRLEELARANGLTVSEDTKFVLLICGRPVLGGDKKYENAFRNLLGIDAVRVSCVTHDKKELAHTLAMLQKSPRVMGALITQPWKIEILELLQEGEYIGIADISDIALKVGAINHIAKRGNRLFADSIDGDAFIRAYTPNFPAGWQNELFTVLGSGGGGREIAFALAGTGVKRFHLVEIPRSLNKALDLREALEKSYAGLSVTVGIPDSTRSRKARSSSRVIINASDVGMDSPTRELTPFADIEGVVSPDQVIIDIIISPDVTGLLEQSFLRGAKVYNGLAMSRLTTVDHIFSFCKTLGTKAPMAKEELLARIIEHSRSTLGRIEAAERLEAEHSTIKNIQSAA
ncbi:MAG: hypothetical protein HQ558_05390 [Candidatus Omnitrophica bacterium]|nr:hypothetical protein [Candidatus Omnitrophota bacterium]